MGGWCINVRKVKNSVRKYDICSKDLIFENEDFPISTMRQYKRVLGLYTNMKQTKKKHNNSFQTKYYAVRCFHLIPNKT